MTFARWRQDKQDKQVKLFEADLIAAELANVFKPLPNGGLKYSGTEVFGDTFALLETGVEFLEPISDADRSIIIKRALEAALRSEDYGASSLIREINRATRDFLRSPETGYVMATGLSFKYFEDITRVEPSGCRLYVRRRLPRYLANAHKEAIRRSNEHILGDYPENAPSKECAAAWIHVRGRSPSEAMQRALEALDLRRGIWNFALSRGSRTFPPPIRGPLNEVLAGPVYSLHLLDGSLATEHDWLNIQHASSSQSRKILQKWDRVRKDETSIRSILKRSPYGPILEDALRRYCRALDSTDLSVAFLNLWSLLEALTGIGPEDSHNKVVKRASFIYADIDRRKREQVLHHLRRHRNSYVHAGEDSQQAGAYLYRLRMYTDQLLEFHLKNSRNLASWDNVVRFLDLPPDENDLESLIQDEKRNAVKAMATVSLAEKGLRFRRGH